MENDYQRSSLWYREEITDPYEVFSEVFSFCSLSGYRRIIKGTLIAAQEMKIYDKVSPRTLLHQYTMIEAVVNAAYILNNCNSNMVLVAEQDRVFSAENYCGSDSHSRIWTDFPRALSRKEYINPFLAFKKFFEYQSIHDWKDCLQNLTDLALSKDNDIDNLFLIPVYLKLTGLMEAAHLIFIRQSCLLEKS